MPTIARTLLPILAVLVVAVSGSADDDRGRYHRRDLPKPVEVVNEVPIAVDVQEPLQVELVNPIEGPPPSTTRTVLRDGNGALVGRITSLGIPPNYGVFVILEVDGREVALLATAYELQSASQLPAGARLESEDCSGEEVPTAMFAGFYAAGNLSGTKLVYSDMAATSGFEAESVLFSDTEDSCQRTSRFVWWEPPDRCCHRSSYRFQVSAPLLEAQIPAFVPPFRILEELAPRDGVSE